MLYQILIVKELNYIIWYRLRFKCPKVNNNVKKIINGLNQLIQNMEAYYQIFNDIYNNYNVNNKNYQVLKNVSQINI